MATTRPTRYLELIVILADHGVEFIVVGGVAAIVEGVPVTTLDLDVVYSATAGNTVRLARALATVNARFRDLAGRVILPTEDRLRRSRVCRLVTDLGPLDAMVEIGAQERFEDLCSDSVVRHLEGREIRVLGLARIIATKEAAGRAKDRATLPVLRTTLELRRAATSLADPER